MTKIDNQQTAGLDKKRGLFAALPDASNEDSSGGAQSDLFEEFSSILDKIAQHVNSSSFRKNDPKSATIDLALSTEVARMPKPEAERPVTRVEKARPIYSESSKENEQPAKTKVDRKASEETSDRPESERKSEKNADTERQSSESENTSKSETTEKRAETSDSDNTDAAKVCDKQQTSEAAATQAFKAPIADETEKQASEGEEQALAPLQQDAVKPESDEKQAAESESASDAKAVTAKATVQQSSEAGEEQGQETAATKQKSVAQSEAAEVMKSDGAKGEVAAGTQSAAAAPADGQDDARIAQIVKALIDGRAQNNSKTVDPTMMFAEALRGQVKADVQNTAAAQIIKQSVEIGAVKSTTASQSNGGMQQFTMQGFANSQSGASSARGEKARSTLPPAPVMQKNMERVETALKEVAKSKDGKTISLRLDPPDLGAVKIDVSLREGSLHARLNADSSKVNQYLREHAFELQTMLRKLGINVERVTVAVGSEQAPQFSAETSTSNDFKQGEKQGNSSEGEVSTHESFDGNESSAPVYDHWVA